MPPPRIAVVGAGLIGRRHAEQAARHGALCAVVDPSEAGADVAAEFGAPHFAALQDCLAAIRPDGAIVATPNDLHRAHAIACMEAGVPVLIEKPIADTLDAADQIVEAIARTGTPALIGHHRRHNPIVKRAKTAIMEGALGDIVVVQGQFWLYKPDDYFDASWRRGAGAGPTLINLIHDIDLLRHLCGEIIDISAMRSNRQRGLDVEDTAALTLRFENDALGAFTLSDSVAAPWSWEMSSAENPIYPHRPGSCYRIGGTKGALSVPDLQLWTHDGPRSWLNPISAKSLKAASTDAFSLQFAHFLDVICGAQPLIDASEGRASLRAVMSVLDAPLFGKAMP